MIGPPRLRLIGAHPVERLDQHVDGDDPLPGQPGGVLLQLAEVAVEVLALVRAQDRHVLVTDLLQDEPVEPVVLSEPARPVASRHEERRVMPVKIARIHLPQHVARGHNRGQTFLARRVLSSQLQGRLVRLGQHLRGYPGVLEGRGERVGDPLGRVLAGTVMESQRTVRRQVSCARPCASSASVTSPGSCAPISKFPFV